MDCDREVIRGSTGTKHAPTAVWGLTSVLNLLGADHAAPDRAGAGEERFQIVVITAPDGALQRREVLAEVPPPAGPRVKAAGRDLSLDALRRGPLQVRVSLLLARGRRRGAAPGMRAEGGGRTLSGRAARRRGADRHRRGWTGRGGGEGGGSPDLGVSVGFPVWRGLEFYSRWLRGDYFGTYILY